MALPASVTIRPLDATHDRAGFQCGKAALDLYLRQQAGQDTKRKANAVFVMVPLSQPNHIWGYYTLCATALTPGDVPEAVRRHVPRYPLVAAILIGRLAIAGDQQGAGLGSILLMDAIERAFLSASTVGACMLVVDAIDERAAAFYAAHGFIRLPQSSRLILPMRTVATLIGER